MSTPPTRELGQPGGIAPSLRVTRRGTKNGYEVEPLEGNAELRFPESIPVYDQIRSQDGHIGSVLTAITLAVNGASWDLRTDGVNDKVVNFVRSQLGIPAPGEARVRQGGRGISWTEHIQQVTETMLWAGFAAFEQVYSIGPATPEMQELGLEDVAYLRKLAPRLPRTITRIETERDGGLKAIWQTPMWEPGKSILEEVEIPVDRLVMYVYRKEGADWSGRSLLRSAYKHWLIKDVFLRLDAQVVERNGMGIPVVTYTNEQHKQIAKNAVEQVRAGAHAGLALPEGCKLSFVGTTGNTVDITPKLKYHDQEMARVAMANFLDLGHDRGSQSLGETLLGVFMDSVQTLADSIAEVTTEHMIRDLVRLNFGEDEPYPVLVPGDLKASRGIATTQLKELVDAGIIQPDDKLEAHERARHGLPEKDAETTRKPSESVTEAETAGALVRAGFEPAAAAEAAGLGKLPHLGLPPVTVQPARANDQPATVQVGEQPRIPEIEDFLAELREAREARTRWYASRHGDK